MKFKKIKFQLESFRNLSPWNSYSIKDRKSPIWLVGLLVAVLRIQITWTKVEPLTELSQE